MSEESEPDRDAMRNGDPDPLGIFWEKIFFPAVFGMIMALTCFWVIVWVIQGAGWSWELLWLLLVIPCCLPVGLLSLWAAVAFPLEGITDLIKGKIEIHGPISSKREIDVEVGTSYIIQVGGQEFSVVERVYNWVKEEEEVVVTCWPRSEEVVEVNKLGAGTIHGGFIDRFD